MRRNSESITSKETTEIKEEAVATKATFEEDAAKALEKKGQGEELKTR